MKSQQMTRQHFTCDVCYTCSTAGEEVINKIALENRKAGRDREEIKLEDLQETLSQAIYNSNTSKCLFKFPHTAISNNFGSIAH